MTRVIAQVGWCFRVLENHLLCRKMIASKCLAGRWRYESWARVREGELDLLSIVFCCSVIVVLCKYCTGVSWVNLTLLFLNSCVDRRGCWKYLPLKFITSCFNLKDNAVGVVNGCWCVVRVPDMASQELLLQIFMQNFFERTDHLFPRNIKFSCGMKHSCR